VKNATLTKDEVKDILSSSASSRLQKDVRTERQNRQLTRVSNDEDESEISSTYIPRECRKFMTDANSQRLHLAINTSEPSQHKDKHNQFAFAVKEAPRIIDLGYHNQEHLLTEPFNSATT